MGNTHSSSFEPRPATGFTNTLNGRQLTPVIYVKTDAGQLAFKTRSGEIPPRLRSVFLLFDGKKSIDTIFAMATELGTTIEDIDYLIASDMLTVVPVTYVEPELNVTAAQQKESARLLAEAQMYASAWPIATQITASLGLRGFRLNLAVEAAMGYTQLCELLPKIQLAVGAEKSRPLEDALEKVFLP